MPPRRCGWAWSATGPSLGNDAELRGGVAWATGFPAAQFANPSSLSLDGDDDEGQATVVGLPDIGEAKTLSLWVWFAQPLPANVRKNLVSLSRFADNAGIQFGFDSGRAALWLRGENTCQVLSSVLSAQTWHHLVYAFDGSVHQLFVDGDLVDDASGAKHVGMATGLFFGSYGGNTQHFGGRIDDLRFYARRLSPAEIGALADGRP
jgi:hypothetical protein